MKLRDIVGRRFFWFWVFMHVIGFGMLAAAWVKFLGH